MHPSTLLSYPVILLLSCIILAGGCTNSSKQMKDNLSGEDSAVLSNILSRTSIRSYKDIPVEGEKIEKLLRAAMASPSAANRQPWHFVVVRDKQRRRALSEANPNASMAQDAPLCIVVCGDLEKALPGEGAQYWVQDASAACQNLLLEATALGLGAVWTGTYPIKDRCDAVSKALSLPDHIVPLCTVCIGYPDSKPQPKDKFDQRKISYETFGGKKVDELSLSDAPAPKKVLHPFDINDDFERNAFNFFEDNGGLILCSGDDKKSNAMTIGWGEMGTLWGRNSLTVYVARARYTREFVDSYPYFTVMKFSDREIARYLGSHSGRDGDKAAALGLHTAYTSNGAPYYEEADLVIECKVMYSDEFEKESFRSSVPENFYRNFPAGLHALYIGEVVGAMKK